MDTSVNNTSHSAHENSAYSAMTLNVLMFCITILGMVAYHKLDKFVSSSGSSVRLIKETEKVITNSPQCADVNVFLKDTMFKNQVLRSSIHYLPKPHGNSKYALPGSLEKNRDESIDLARMEHLPIGEASRLVDKCRSRLNSHIKVGDLIRECNMGDTEFSGHRIRIILVNRDKQPLTDTYFNDVIGIAILCEKYPSNTRELLSCQVVDIMNVGATTYDRLPENSSLRVPQYQIVFDSNDEDAKSPIKNYSFARSSALMEEETKLTPL
jgi:hypothetical protein